MSKRLAAGAVAAAAAVVLAGCGSAQAVHQDASPAAHPAPSPATTAGTDAGGFGTSAAIANPVPILKLIGCPVPASERYGSIGLDADRVASCTFPGGEQVYVFTYASQNYRDSRLAHPLLPPSDGDYPIRGPGASIVDVDTTGGSGPSPQQIASRVHGTLLGS